MVSAIVCWIIGALCYLIAFSSFEFSNSVFDDIRLYFIISNGTVFIVGGIILSKINTTTQKLLDRKNFFSRNVTKHERKELLENEILDKNLGTNSSENWLCTKCGTLNEANSPICEKCGRRI